MDKKQFVEIMKKIKSAYGERFGELNSDMMNTWYEALNVFTVEMLKESVIEFIRENRFPPTVCDIYQKCREKEKSNSDGWQ